MKRNSTLAAAIGLAALSMTPNALACSTIIVGSEASATGTVIVGHNEDNGGRILTAQYYVPAEEHKAGEMIRYEPKAAAIPQVEKTLGFYWSQTYDPAGASFSDSFVNDAGVTIVSNNCARIFKENIQPLHDGGIGYGIRRLLAERAHSAREAVEIATDLLARYGYLAEGRTYTIADPKEAWQIAIHQGSTWAARRVKDNEVVYIPNNFMMEELDATDTENVRVAPGMIERAIEQGRYKPATAGVYKDFNFRKALQPESRRSQEYNLSRNHLAWKKITGKDITDPEAFPYSAVVDRKFSVEDIKDILRTHEAGLGETYGWFHQKGNGVCRTTTHESAVYVMNRDPLLIKGYRTHARPCESPYVPFYPLAAPAEGTAFLDWRTATEEHFKGTAENFSCNSAWPVWTFVNYANTVDFQHEGHADNAAFLASLEKKLTEKDEAVRIEAEALLRVSPAKARALLHGFNLRTFRDAERAVAHRTEEIAPHGMAVLADAIDPESETTVDVVLFSDASLDAPSVDVAKTTAGLGRASVGNSGAVEKLAKPIADRTEDINGDGKPDLVLSFRQKDLAAGMIPGAVFDTWLYTSAGGKALCASDAVAILKK